MLRERAPATTGRARSGAARAVAPIPLTGSIFTATLRRQRRALAWWTIGLAGVALMYLAVWPAIRDNAAAFKETLDRLPEVFRTFVGDDFTSPAGYLRAELFSLMAPIMLLVAAIGAGARATASDERTGMMDLLLSTPVRRRTIVLHKAGAIAAVAAMLSSVPWIVVATLGPVFGLRVSPVNLAAMTVHLCLFAIALGMIAMAVGAATGRRGVAAGAAGGFAVVSFVLHSVAPSITALERIRFLSPYTYYLDHDPIRLGIHGGDVAVLAAIAAVALAVAVRAFERRDVAV